MQELDQWCAAIDVAVRMPTLAQVGLKIFDLHLLCQSRCDAAWRRRR
jgi:hypothetical protein